MDKRLLAILVVALFVLPSVSVAYSKDTSVTSTGNTVYLEDKKTVVENIVEDVNDELSTTNPGYTAEVNPDNPDEIHIVGPGNGDSTVNQRGDVDLTLTLPANTELMISIHCDFSIFSTFNFSMMYNDVTYGQVTCHGEIEFSILSTKYFYPQPTMTGDNGPGTIVAVPDGADYHDYGFVSMDSITFNLNGMSASRLNKLDLNIIVL